MRGGFSSNGKVQITARAGIVRRSEPQVVAASPRTSSREATAREAMREARAKRFGCPAPPPPPPPAAAVSPGGKERASLKRLRDESFTFNYDEDTETEGATTRVDTQPRRRVVDMMQFSVAHAETFLDSGGLVDQFLERCLERTTEPMSACARARDYPRAPCRRRAGSLRLCPCVQ